MFTFLIAVFSICALLLNPVQAQYRDSGFEVGVLGGTAYDNSTGVDDAQPGRSRNGKSAAAIRSCVAATRIPF